MLKSRFFPANDDKGISLMGYASTITAMYMYIRVDWSISSSSFPVNLRQREKKEVHTRKVRAAVISLEALPVTVTLVPAVADVGTPTLSVIVLIYHIQNLVLVITMMMTANLSNS